MVNHFVIKGKLCTVNPNLRIDKYGRRIWAIRTKSWSYRWILNERKAKGFCNFAAGIWQVNL